jgi:hypothetical protein
VFIFYSILTICTVRTGDKGKERYIKDKKKSASFLRYCEEYELLYFKLSNILLKTLRAKVQFCWLIEM